MSRGYRPGMPPAYDDNPRPVPTGESRIVLVCSECGADLWPAIEGQLVAHDCLTGEVSPGDKPFPSPPRAGRHRRHRRWRWWAGRR
jgi:hypothetical protein